MQECEGLLKKLLRLASYWEVLLEEFPKQSITADVHKRNAALHSRSERSQ